MGIVNSSEGKGGGTQCRNAWYPNWWIIIKFKGVGDRESREVKPGDCPRVHSSRYTHKGIIVCSLFNFSDISAKAHLHDRAHRYRLVFNAESMSASIASKIKARHLMCDLCIKWNGVAAATANKSKQLFWWRRINAANFIRCWSKRYIFIYIIVVMDALKQDNGLDFNRQRYRRNQICAAWDGDPEMWMSDVAE